MQATRRIASLLRHLVGRPPGAINETQSDPERRPERQRHSLTLFYARELRNVAEAVVAQSGGLIVLGEVVWNHFEDGLPNLLIKDAAMLRNQRCALLCSMHVGEVVFEQAALMWAIPQQLPRSFSIVLPYFATGTYERVEVPGEVATAYSLAKVFDQTPPTASGPAAVTIFDIHALPVQFYFAVVKPVLMTCMSLLTAELERLPHRELLSIVFPDEGAGKRFSRYFSGFAQVACTKKRDGAKRVVFLREGDPCGRHCMIVDDLVRTGGTLVECAGLLHRLGAASVSVFCTHAVFPEQSWRRFAHPQKEGALAAFYVTDTHPNAALVRGVEPFRVLSIAPLVRDALLQDLD